MKREDLFRECEKLTDSIRTLSSIYQNPVSMTSQEIETIREVVKRFSEDFDTVRNNLEIVLEALSNPSKELDSYNKSICNLNKAYISQDFNTFDLIDNADNLFDKLTERYKQKLNVKQTEDKNEMNKSENHIKETKVSPRENIDDSNNTCNIDVLSNNNLKLWICGDTPKSIYGNDLTDKRYALLKKVIEKILLKLINQGIKEFLVGVNRGFDMLCLEVLCKLKKNSDIKIYVVSPYYSYISKRSSDELEQYSQLVKQSDSLFYIDKIYPKQYNSVNELLKAKNQFLVDYAQYGLTMHIDGIENSVSNAISIAEGKTKTIFSIDKETLKVSKKK